MAPEAAGRGAFLHDPTARGRGGLPDGPVAPGATVWTWDVRVLEAHQGSEPTGWLEP